jgi:hypothetical protein
MRTDKRKVTLLLSKYNCSNVKVPNRRADDLSSQAARTMTFQDIKADAEKMYNWSLRT